jgi:hypothetical protein
MLRELPLMGESLHAYLTWLFLRLSLRSRKESATIRWAPRAFANIVQGYSEIVGTLCNLIEIGVLGKVTLEYVSSE